MYTEETILTFGKYKFHRLGIIPESYLLNLYNNNKSTIDNQELMEYIERNYLDKLKNKPQVKVVPEIIRCEKLTYPTEKDAKYEIRRIRDREQKNSKKPVRAYECDDCGGWHLTSIPFEDWRNKR